MGKVKTKDSGFPPHLRKAINDAKGARVDVGFFPDSKSSDGKTFLAEQALYNEFGAPRANIKERSFMRSTVDENDYEYKRDLEDISGDIMAGKISIVGGLSKFGQWVRDDIVKKIIAIRTPENLPSTEKKKGFNNPLIETGHMKDNVRYRVTK